MRDPIDKIAAVCVQLNSLFDQADSLIRNAAGRADQAELRDLVDLRTGWRERSLESLARLAVAKA